MLFRSYHFIMEKLLEAGAVWNDKTLDHLERTAPTGNQFRGA